MYNRKHIYKNLTIINDCQTLTNLTRLVNDHHHLNPQGRMTSSGTCTASPNIPPLKDPSEGY